MAKRPFSGIAPKLGAIFALFACVLFGIAYQNISVFQQVSRDMDYFNDVRVPDLVVRSEVVNNAGGLRDIFSSMLLANDPNVVDALLTAADTPLAAIDIAASEVADTAENSTETSELRQKILRLADARKQEFEQQTKIEQSFSEMKALVASLNEQLVSVTDEAIFELSVVGEETVSLVGTTLNQLVEIDLASLKIALLARSYMNYYSGVAMAISGTNDASFRTLLIELAITADSGLEGLKSDLIAFETLAPMLDPIAAFRQVAQSALRGGRPPLADIIATRSEAEKAIASVIDEIEFSLFITASDIQSSNEAAIRDLIDTQVAAILESGQLSVAVRSTVITALQAGAARTSAEISDLGTELGLMIQKLEELAASGSSETEETISRLVALVNPASGIPALRLQELEAHANASDTASAAAEALLIIVSGANQAMSASLQSIATTSDDLRSQMLKAEDRSYTIIGGASVILVLVFLGTRLSIVRPLKKLSRVTDQLSNGNLDPIGGMDRYGGEIGQMASALKVFRARMLDRVRLEEEQKTAEVEREAARKLAEQEKLAAAEREEATERKRLEDRLAIEAEEERKRISIEQKAEAERQTRANELQSVVGALANGLKKLSDGNLQARIEIDFPAAYQQLKDDYNLAVDKLSGILVNISNAGQTIREASQEISSSALDLSSRSEVSASTLEETARSLRELAKSVQTTASGANSANEIGRRTVDTAEQGATVVRECVASMNSVEKSSKEISKVVAVIEDIAFQTNLLALNAGVEAARAGDSGRGFAVVASEVRALAQRSSDAAQEINQLITESNKTVDAGVAATGKAGASLDNIVAAVTEIAGNISEIAASAQQQSASIDEISRGAGALDEATQQNAALFEETTAANQRLSNEAISLDTQLKTFVLPTKTDGPSPMDIAV